MTNPAPLDIIATINLHLLEVEHLRALHAKGATLFRINGAHVVPERVGAYVAKIREAVGTRARILLDLPGNKVRIANLPSPIALVAGEEFRLSASQLNFPEFLERLAVGDRILANDCRYTFTVTTRDAETVGLTSATDGVLLNNKGIHLVGKALNFPILMPRDEALMAAAIRGGVDVLGLSFVRTAEDVQGIRARLGDAAIQLLVKIETLDAVTNLDAILAHGGDDYLIDRGDLSYEVGLEKIDWYQKSILRRIKQRGKRTFLATQFLTSMLDSRIPSVSEAAALADALECGVDGLQFSEETAIGKYPFDVLDFVQRVLTSCKGSRRYRRHRFAPVLWLTGRSGAGKSTIAERCRCLLEAEGLRVCVVDGDEFRHFFGNSVGYTKDDRELNQKNLAFAAFQASKIFDVVIVSSLSPSRVLREFARERIERFHEIYIECPVEVCRQRDPKGHYKRAAEGQLPDFLSKADDYEVPSQPELTLHTGVLALDICAKSLLEYLDRVTA